MTRLPSLPLVALLAAPAISQTVFDAVEPNDTKDQATPALGMQHGDSLEVLYGCPPRLDPEIFHVRTAPLAPGIYRHQLLPQFVVSGCYPTILGRSQFNSDIDLDSTVVIQEATNATATPRFLQWYGFGAAEEMYVDLDDTSTCRTSLKMTLNSTPVAPTVIPNAPPAGSFVPITLAASSPSIDIDLTVFDSDFDALPESGYRRDINTGEPGGGFTANAGTYFLAVSQGPLLTSLPGFLRDDYNSDDVTDFRGAVLSGRHDVGASFELVVGNQSVQGTFTDPYEVMWFSMDVGQPATSITFCAGDGTSGACACGESAVGQRAGCLNSTGRGAHLFADGYFSANQMRFELEDLPPATSYLLFASLSTQAGSPVFGGRVCLGGGGIRLYVDQADANGNGHYDVGSSFTSAGYMAGTNLFVQAVYRDNAAGGACVANVTNGEAVTILF